MNGMHGIIFSYEKKTGLRELIEHRIHGSIPFGGNYRVVDFMLSNMVGAGVRDVGVIMHGKCQSMLDHLGTGKSWDLSRKTGGLKLLPAFAYSESRGVVGAFRGKMEALGCVIEYLRHIRQDYVVLSDSDLVTNLPLTRVLEAHIASGADMTCVCTSHPGESGDTYFKLDNTGRIVDTAYDIRTPEGYQSLNIFLLGRDLLLELVEDCMAHDRYSFRHNVLQDKGKELRFNGYVWDGFAARINSVQGYYQRSMELLRPEIRAELFCPQRPVYAHITVYEEVGHGGCFIPQDTEEMLSVDMGCVGEGLECTDRQVSICVKDGHGPYHYDVVKALIQAAKDNHIDYAADVYPYYGSDADAALSAGIDARHGLIGPGVYASHGYERSHKDAVAATLELLKAYLA